MLSEMEGAYMTRCPKFKPLDLGSVFMVLVAWKDMRWLWVLQKMLTSVRNGRRHCDDMEELMPAFWVMDTVVNASLGLLCELSVIGQL